MPLFSQIEKPKLSSKNEAERGMDDHFYEVPGLVLIHIPQMWLDVALDNSHYVVLRIIKGTKIFKVIFEGLSHGRAKNMDIE